MLQDAGSNLKQLRPLPIVLDSAEDDLVYFGHHVTIPLSVDPEKAGLRALYLYLSLSLTP